MRLTAAQALPAIEAFVAGAVADGDVAAVGAGGGVLLEVGQGIVEGLDGLREGGRELGMAVAIAPAAGFHVRDFVLLGQRRKGR
jgi:hypothetical protein